MTKDIKNEGFDFNKHPSDFENTLIKLPGKNLNVKEVTDFIDFYFNFGFLNESKKALEFQSFKFNLLIASKMTNNVNPNSKKNKILIDKTLNSFQELVKILKNLDDLKNSLVIIHFYPYAKMSGDESLKCNFAPFGYYPSLKNSISQQGYMFNQGIKMDDNVSTDFNTVDNFIFSFTGKSSLNLDPLCKGTIEKHKNYDYNYSYQIANFMFKSNLVKNILTYGNINLLGKFIEKYIKPKFLMPNFNYVLFSQENLNDVYISKNCKKLSDGVYITNGEVYDFMLNNPEIVDKFVITDSSSFTKLWDSVLTSKNVTTTGVPAPIPTTGAKIGKIIDISSKKNTGELVINKETNFNNLKERNIFRILPVLTPLLVGCVCKDGLECNGVKIPIGSNVHFKQATVPMDLHQNAPYICTITSVAVGKTVYTKVMTAEEINKFMILIPKLFASNFLYRYKNDLLKPLIQSNLTSLAVLEHVSSYADLLSNACTKYTKDKIIEENYIIKTLKINGFNRHNVPMIHLFLAIAEHAYYQNSAKLNIIGGLLLLTYLEKIRDTFENWAAEEVSIDTELINTTVKIGDFHPLFEDVMEIDSYPVD